eukprot:3534620-Alexandrium_andersonii.AAC.1
MFTRPHGRLLMCDHRPRCEHCSNLASYQDYATSFAQHATAMHVLAHILWAVLARRGEAPLALQAL